MNQIKEKQTPNRQRLMSKVAADASPAEFNQVIGQRARQISPGAYIGNDLQPRSDVRDLVAAEGSRDVKILAARLASE